MAVGVLVVVEGSTLQQKSNAIIYSVLVYNSKIFYYYKRRSWLDVVKVGIRFDEYRGQNLLQLKIISCRNFFVYINKVGGLWTMRIFYNFRFNNLKISLFITLLEVQLEYHLFLFCFDLM